jgi:hypothetical protein
MAYWYNVDTRQVETEDTRSQGDHVMGPYATEAEAAAALDTAREKTEKWDAEDRAWEEGPGGWDDRDAED